MPRKDYLDRKPLIHPTAFVAKSADLIGAVTVEEEASIWYGAVLRADIQEIKLPVYEKDGKLLTHIFLIQSFEL